MLRILRNYSYILSKPPEIIGRKLRLYFKDASVMDVWYPNNKEYSLHWKKNKIIVRIDTAPHHKHVRTFPVTFTIARKQHS